MPLKIVPLRELVADKAITSLQGVSGNVFRTRDARSTGAFGETGYHDRLTWLRAEGVVLCERQGRLDELLPIGSVARMTPIQDLRANLVTGELEPALGETVGTEPEQPEPTGPKPGGPGRKASR